MECALAGTAEPEGMKAMAKATDKCRTGIPGVAGLGKVVNSNAWGDAKATERYGGGTRTYGPPKDQSMPQFPEDKRGPDWADDVPVSSWLRGGNESGKAMLNAWENGLSREQ